MPSSAGKKKHLRACDVPCPFFFTDTATTEIYTLSLHDALPISSVPTGLPPRLPSGRKPPCEAPLDCGSGNAGSATEGRLGDAPAPVMRARKFPDERTNRRGTSGCAPPHEDPDWCRLRCAHRH